MSHIPPIPPIAAQSFWSSDIAGHAAKTDALGYRDKAAPFTDCRDFDSVAKAFREELLSLCETDERRYRPIAICGRWGSGKTSFINRVLGKSDFDYGFFEPWMFSGTNGLLEQFFNELEDVADEETALLIDGYGRLFASIVGSGLGEPLNSGGLREITDAMTQFLDPSRKMTSLGFDSVRKLRDLKARIEEGLETTCGNRPKIVVIDNIDRLTPDEIVQMFRFVSTVVDFPGILYVLLFDDKVVTQALVNRLGLDGYQEGELYLDKIVSLRIKLPNIEMEEIARRELELIDPQLARNQFYCRGIAALFDSPRSLESAMMNYRGEQILNGAKTTVNAPVTEHMIAETMFYLSQRMASARAGHIQFDFKGKKQHALDLDKLIEEIWRYPEFKDDLLNSASQTESSYSDKQDNLSQNIVQQNQQVRILSVRREVDSGIGMQNISEASRESIRVEFLTFINWMPDSSSSGSVKQSSTEGPSQNADDSLGKGSGKNHASVFENKANDNVVDREGGDPLEDLSADAAWLGQQIGEADGRVEETPEILSNDKRGLLKSWLALRLAGLEHVITTDSPAVACEYGPAKESKNPAYPLDVFFRIVEMM